MDVDSDAKAAALGEHYGYHMPVARLLALGRPGEDTSDRWPTAQDLGLGLEHVPELIRMLQDERWYARDLGATEPYASIHAWRVLADLRAEEAIPALIAVLARSDEEWDDWATEEIPEVLGIIGPAAIPALGGYLERCSDELESCADAAHALQEIASRHPEVRDRAMGILTAKLEHHAEQDSVLNGFLISYLIDLKAVESASAMEAAFAAGVVHLAIAGDWEDVQIELGLRTERSTPPPDPFRALREELLSEMRAGALGEPRESAGREPQAPAQRKAAADKKAKRKQAEQTRKQARRRQKR